MNWQLTSPLFRLPAELRNRIYALAFNTFSLSDGNSDTPTNLDAFNILRPSPPTRDLLLICRKIQHEAKGLRKTAFCDYWKHATIPIDATSPAPIKNFNSIADEDFAHIMRLDVHYAANGKLFELKIIKKERFEGESHGRHSPWDVVAELEDTEYSIHDERSNHQHALKMTWSRDSSDEQGRFLHGLECTLF